MFEFSKYEGKLHTTPPATPNHAPVVPEDGIAGMSFLLWGEHCVECAAPSCYTSCELYQERPDRRCRRLQYGMYANRAFGGTHGCGAEMVFKKWGQLAACGNTWIEPLKSVRRKERWIGRAQTLVDGIGAVISRITGDIRWNYASFALLERWSRRLHRKTRTSSGSQPDAFLLEVYNPAGQVSKMQVAMRPAKMGNGNLVVPNASFVTTVELPPGYSRFEFDRRLFQSLLDSKLPFDMSITPEADSAAHLVFLTADFVTYSKRPEEQTGNKKKNVKCVVWDLDNTLWSGTLVENPNVTINPEIPALLKHLDERGVLLSVASKNDYESAWAQLQACGISEYFVYPQINWMPKSENIKTLAKRLNIGLDTFAFIDDSPFELAEVSRSLPEITCLHISEIDRIRTDARFQGSQTSDARQRRQFYKEAIVREEKQAQFGNDYLGFLEYCEIELQIGRYEEADLERVSELVQRTNQLNFSGRKYSTDELRVILADPRREKYVLRCSDKFGDYGTVGFSIVSRSPEELRVEDFMLSCRVQGKLIEQAFFSFLQAHAGEASTLLVNFRATARNKPALQVLEFLGFENDQSAGGRRIRLEKPIAPRQVISVADHTGAGLAEPTCASKN